MRKLTTDEFIIRAKKIHGDKYDYSKTDYVNGKIKVVVTCKEHGDFNVSPLDHLRGVGCKKCGISLRASKKRLTTADFVKKAKQIHGDKYDYSKVIYEKSNKKVCIICPKHGEFWQTPNRHLSGRGCKKCSNERLAISLMKSKEQFIEEATKVHKNKYDYSKVEYKGNKKKVCIICPEHGEFWQTPNSHIQQKSGCPKCSKQFMDGEYFIECANKIHGNKYDYTKVAYENNKTRVCIICPKHGEFWQTPSLHINQKCGCPSCSESHLEKMVAMILDKCGIKYERERMFNWLGLQRLDFYIPGINIGIECQGIQHFTRQYFGKSVNGTDQLKYIKHLDDKKRKLCEENNLPLFYVNYDDNIEIRVKQILIKNGLQL